MNVFDDVKTLDELKKAYHRAAMKHHPDRGGDPETMKKINADYETRFHLLKNQQNEAAAHDQTGKTRATCEDAGDFIEIITELLKIPDIVVELCGRWLWISGDTRPHKEELKKAGCRWCSTKKLWSWHFAGDATCSKGGRTMAEIRDVYGSTIFGRGPDKPLLDK